MQSGLISPLLTWVLRDDLPLSWVLASWEVALLSVISLSSHQKSFSTLPSETAVSKPGAPRSMSTELRASAFLKRLLKVTTLSTRTWIPRGLLGRLVTLVVDQVETPDRASSAPLPSLPLCGRLPARLSPSLGSAAVVLPGAVPLLRKWVEGGNLRAADKAIMGIHWRAVRVWRGRETTSTQAGKKRKEQLLSEWLEPQHAQGWSHLSW